MKIIDLKIDTDDPAVAGTVIKSLKSMRGDILGKIRNLSDQYRYDNSRIKHEHVLQIEEMVKVLKQVSQQIEDCENGTNILEG